MSDDFSSNTSTSGTIEINGFTNGNIERADDHDWFKVHLVGGISYRFAVVGAGGNPIKDTTLGLFDSAGNDTNFSNDDANGTFFSEFLFTPRTSGDFFVDVGGFGTNTGTYQVSASIDDFAAGTSTTGLLAVNGAPSAGTVNEAGDHDWFRVSLTAGVTYRFDTTGNGIPGINLDRNFMRLFDSSRNAVAFAEGAIDPSTTEIVFTPTVSGDYFVEVSAADATATGGYVVTAAVDDFQAGVPSINSGTHFGAVTVNGPGASGTIEQRGDHDWFAVNLVAGTHYQIHTTSSTLTETRTAVYDSSGRLLGSVPLLDFTPATSGTYYIDASAGDGAVVTGAYTVSVVTANANGDFDRNGHSDLLWRSSTGQLADWSMNGGAIASSAELTFNGRAVRPDASWSIVATTDFNDDGDADILWRNANGQTVLWSMNGGTIASSAEVTLNGIPQRLDASWNVAAVGDFSGGADGNEDRAVLWRNTTTNQLLEWNMGGSKIASVFSGFPAPDKAWSVAGVGDFDGSTADDIVWRNTSGEVVVWFMQDTEINISHDVTSAGKPVSVDQSWTMVGAGDFNADGKSDMLWRNTAGQVVEWQMNGSAVAASGFVNSQGAVIAPDASWHIVQIGDFNGDSKSDILWRSDSGAMAEWLMNGSQITASVSPSLGSVAVHPDGSWQVQAKPTQFN